MVTELLLPPPIGITVAPTGIDVTVALVVPLMRMTAVLPVPEMAPTALPLEVVA